MIPATDPRFLDPGEDASLGRLLALTAKASRELFDARLAESGGSLPTWIVLSQAIDSPVSPSQSELAARMGIGGATLVRHLDRLEADGLVVRRGDPDDRRVTRVDITAAGRRRHRQLAAVADAYDREVKDLMSDEEARVLPLGARPGEPARPHRTPRRVAPQAGPSPQVRPDPP